MDLEKKIKYCEDNLRQIKNFNPDPYYVGYFLEAYLNSVNEVYDGIFEEANIDFGLFMNGIINKENFEKRAIEKKDLLAEEFFSWFEKNYEDEHSNNFPDFIKKILDYFAKNKTIPKITIKILANKKYRNDVVQQIQVDLFKGKLRSKETLEIEVKRNIPVFLEFINQKRKNNDEPRVTESDISVSSFLDLQNYEQIEIPYACEIYLTVLKRLVKESREKIKKLIQFV